MEIAYSQLPRDDAHSAAQHHRGEQHNDLGGGLEHPEVLRADLQRQTECNRASDESANRDEHDFVPLQSCFAVEREQVDGHEDADEARDDDAEQHGADQRAVHVARLDRERRQTQVHVQERLGHGSRGLDGELRALLAFAGPVIVGVVRHGESAAEERDDARVEFGDVLQYQRRQQAESHADCHAEQRQQNEVYEYSKVLFGAQVERREYAYWADSRVLDGGVHCAEKQDRHCVVHNAFAEEHCVQRLVLLHQRQHRDRVCRAQHTRLYPITRV